MFSDNSVPINRDFHSCDYALLNEHMRKVNWEAVLNEDDLNKNVSTFNEISVNNTSIFVPLSKYTPNNFPKCYSSELKCLIIAKK